MSYDEEHQRRSRVVVETPTSRREVVQSQTVRAPERTGYSTGMVAAVALAAIAATAIIFLFLTNKGGGSETNVNVRTAAQPTPVTQQPVYVQQPAAPQPTPIIIQQPATTQPAPVIIAPPATTTAAPPVTTTTTAPPVTAPKTSSAPDDTTLQAGVDRAFTDDTDLGTADVTAVVVEGKVTLNGTVNSQELKQRAAKLAYRVKGVRSVDNKIVVSGSQQP